MSDVDSGGRRLLTTGSWTAGSTPDVSVQGGQSMHFAVTNANILGASVSIKAQDGEQFGMIILPATTGDFVFASFGNEPTSWTFTPTIDSDAAVVTWKLYSTWIPGDPPNPPNP